MGFCTAAELRDVLGMKASEAAAAPFEEEGPVRKPLPPLLLAPIAPVCVADDIREGRELPGLLANPYEIGPVDEGDGASVLTWLGKPLLSVFTRRGGEETW